MLTFSQIGLLTTTSVRETDVFFTRQERSDPVSPAAGSFLARRAGERQAGEGSRSRRRRGRQDPV